MFEMRQFKKGFKISTLSIDQNCLFFLFLLTLKDGFELIHVLLIEERLENTNNS